MHNIFLKVFRKLASVSKFVFNLFIPVTVTGMSPNDRSNADFVKMKI